MTLICRKCERAKPEDQFHRAGQRGRHVWCRECFNAYKREREQTHRDPTRRRANNLHTRYRISEADIATMLEQQGGVCAICGGPSTPQRVDHDHVTGQVRGILCHRCNIRLNAVEDSEFLDAALNYLGRS